MNPSTLAVNSVPHSEAPSETPQPWASMVERIRAGDPSGMEELYGVFTTGIRFYLCRGPRRPVQRRAQVRHRVRFPPRRCTAKPVANTSPRHTEWRGEVCASGKKQ